jgi:predicted deacylase
MYKNIECNKPEVKEMFRGNGLLNILFVTGTHGDEPAGDISVHNYNYNDVYNLNITICRVNPCGLIDNTRHNPTTNFDINREYGKDNYHNKIVENLVMKNDMIFDFHEGWDYHIINKNSIGSTLSSPNNINISHYIIEQVNKSIQEPNKKFVFENTKSLIKGSLKEFCLKVGKKYVLVETTRIEELETRVYKNNIIIKSIIEYLSTS